MVANEISFPALRSANANKDNMFLHSYATKAAPVPMDKSKPNKAGANAGSTSTRRPLSTTSTKLPSTKKLAVETESTLTDVLAAIKSLDSKVESFGKQLRESSEMVASIVQCVDN